MQLLRRDTVDLAFKGGGGAAGGFGGGTGGVYGIAGRLQVRPTAKTLRYYIVLVVDPTNTSTRCGSVKVLRESQRPLAVFGVVQVLVVVMVMVLAVVMVVPLVVQVLVVVAEPVLGESVVVEWLVRDLLGRSHWVGEGLVKSKRQQLSNGETEERDRVLPVEGMQSGEAGNTGGASQLDQSIQSQSATNPVPRPIPTGPRADRQKKPAQAVIPAVATVEATKASGPADTTTSAAEGTGTAEKVAGAATGTSGEKDVEMVGSSGTVAADASISKTAKGKDKEMLHGMGRFLTQPRLSKHLHPPFPSGVDDATHREIYNKELKEYYTNTKDAIRAFTAGIINELPLPPSLLKRDLMDQCDPLILALSGFFYGKLPPPSFPGTVHVVERMACVLCGPGKTTCAGLEFGRIVWIPVFREGLESDCLAQGLWPSAKSPGAAYAASDVVQLPGSGYEGDPELDRSGATDQGRTGLQLARPDTDDPFPPETRHLLRAAVTRPGLNSRVGDPRKDRSQEPSSQVSEGEGAGGGEDESGGRGAGRGEKIERGREEDGEGEAGGFEIGGE